jgi:AraC-like DNA-binding protein
MASAGIQERTQGATSAGADLRGTPGPAARVRELRFSTSEIPDHDRFDAWRERLSAWMEVSRPDMPSDGFRADQRTWQLGPLAVSANSGDGLLNLRDRARIRRDQLDHWLIVLPQRGQLQYDDGRNMVQVDERSLLLCGLHVPSVTRRSEADWILAFVARDALSTIAPGFDALIGRTLNTALGGLLRGHLVELVRQLPEMTVAEVPKAAEATLAVIRAAVSGSADDCEAARPQLEAIQRSRVLATIRAHLGSVRLDPERLRQMVGMSRSQLYRLFESDGGVARAIKRERLRAIRRALADPAERRHIAAIAEAMGMADPSSFGRAFRQEFGMNAMEFRSEALHAGSALPPGGSVPRHAQDLNAVLRQLAA